MANEKQNQRPIPRIVSSEPPYFNHEILLALYRAGKMTPEEHFRLTMECPAFNAFCYGAEWLRQNGPSHDPMFFIFNGHVAVKWPTGIKAFDLMYHDDYLEEANAWINAAYAKGSDHMYGAYCAAICDLIVARAEIRTVRGG